MQNNNKIERNDNKNILIDIKSGIQMISSSLYMIKSRVLFRKNINEKKLENLVLYHFISFYVLYFVCFLLIQ